MKALAAPHNQQAISQLIFHPAIVMSSPGAGIIHNSPCYDKLRPGGQGGIWTLSGPMSSSCHLCWSNRSGLVGGSCEIGSGIKHEIGQAYLNTMWRHETNGFLTLVVPQRFLHFHRPLPSRLHRHHLSSADAFISKKKKGRKKKKHQRWYGGDNNSYLQNTVNQISVSLLQQGGWASTKVGGRALKSYKCSPSLLPSLILTHRNASFPLGERLAG